MVIMMQMEIDSVKQMQMAIGTQREKLMPMVIDLQMEMKMRLQTVILKQMAKLTHQKQWLY